MRRKNVRYTRHATQRKLERNITDEEITETLENPDYTILREGRKIAVKRFDRKVIRVVHVEEATYIRIITVY